MHEPTVAQPGEIRSQRLFFALWPNEQTARQLRKLQSSLSNHGRPVAPENFHVTLAFIGNVGSDRAACLREAAAGVQAVPFTLTLDSLGYFRKPQIAWVGPSQAPAELIALQASLSKALSPCGFIAEARGFHPHVSLFRKAGLQVEQKAKPVEWRADDFVLVESVTTEAGPRYSIIERYPFNR